MIKSNGTPSLPFHFHSPLASNNLHESLVSTELIREDIYKQIAAPYLVKKLNITSMHEIHWGLRKDIVNLLPKSLHTWLSKSFTNFAGTAHQLHRQQIFSSSICRVCNSMDETDTLHVLSCPHKLFTQHKNEVASELQLKVRAAARQPDQNLEPIL